MTETGSIQNEGLEEVTKQLGFLVHLRSSVATLVQLALENQGAPAGTYTQLPCCAAARTHVHVFLPTRSVLGIAVGTNRLGGRH